MRGRKDTFSIARFAAVVAASVLLAHTPNLNAAESRGRLNFELGRRWRLRLPLSLQAALGYLDGLGTRHGRDAVAVVRLKATFRFILPRRLEVKPWLSFASRETFTESLAERSIAGGAKFKARLAKRLRIGIEGQAGLKSRPDWPDQYQPEVDAGGNPTGRLLPTDRYTYRHVGARLFLRGTLARGMKLEGHATTRYLDYEDDPNYDGANEPTHLTPADKVYAGGGIRWAGKAFAGRWRYSLQADTTWIHYFKTYSRDAGTGLTHANPGGQPPNPLQRFLRVDLTHGSRIEIPRARSAVVVGIGFEHNNDLFQGYYTWNQVQWTAGVELSIAEWMGLEVRYEGRWRRYTSSGYQQGANHPPLDDGDTTRMSHAHAVAGLLELATGISGLST
ncbi:MAG: hypothetical protein D6806_13775, partial [Deltaproteobacteria bacterium]